LEFSEFIAFANKAIANLTPAARKCRYFNKRTIDAQKWTNFMLSTF